MQRYEREIAELLEELEARESRSSRSTRTDIPPPLPRRRNHSPPPVRPSISIPSLSPGQWMATGLGLVILSWLIPVASVQQWLAIAGVLLFLVPVGLSILRRDLPSRDEKLWRGRPIHDRDSSWDRWQASVEQFARGIGRRFRRH